MDHDIDGKGNKLVKDDDQLKVLKVKENSIPSSTTGIIGNNKRISRETSDRSTTSRDLSA